MEQQKRNHVACASAICSRLALTVITYARTRTQILTHTHIYTYMHKHTHMPTTDNNIDYLTISDSHG